MMDGLFVSVLWITIDDGVGATGFRGDEGVVREQMIGEEARLTSSCTTICPDPCNEREIVDEQPCCDKKSREHASLATGYRAPGISITRRFPRMLIIYISTRA